MMLLLMTAFLGPSFSHLTLVTMMIWMRVDVKDEGDVEEDVAQEVDIDDEVDDDIPADPDVDVLDAADGTVDDDVELGANFIASSRLCWPILGAILAHLDVILGHFGGYVGPFSEICWPILEPKTLKKRHQKNTPKNEAKNALASGLPRAPGRKKGPFSAPFLRPQK